MQFTPLNRKGDHLTYDFEVDLSSEDISPFDIWGMGKFYIPTAEEQEKIDFVNSAFNFPSTNFNNWVVEESDMYRININNDLSFGRYFIDKATGEECMGSIQGSNIPMPDIPGLPSFPDPLIEIVE